MNYNWFLNSLVIVLFCTSCVTTKIVEREKSMSDWLENANLPVTVIDQSRELKCKVGLNCYTLIDAKGRIFYINNVRPELPRIIPEDTTQINRPFLEQLLGIQ